MTDNYYRSRHVIQQLSQALEKISYGLGDITIMHVCGTHEHEIVRHSLRQLLPPNIKLIAGPGCPVCITPASVIATAITIALHPDRPILCTYGDMVRIPITGGALWEKRGLGADIRIVYSVRDAMKLAYDNPDRQVVFLSVGFETTTAPVAALIKAGLPDNFLLYCCHRYVPPAVEALTKSDGGAISGYLLPGHASVITGVTPYRFLPEQYHRASAITGFEPVDIIAGVLSIIRQIESGRPTVDNCYPRAVRDKGNVVAQQSLMDVFDCCDARWRGIGIIPKTGFELKQDYQKYNALTHYNIIEQPAEDLNKGCKCHLILTGRCLPYDCPLFRTVCSPETPQGPCMVSSEGTCRAHYLYPENGDAR